jgi:hypothetical protein
LEYILIFLCGVLFWFKSNSKIVFQFNWSPWEWWLYTGLLSNYMTLYSWWHLMDKHTVWHATAIWVLLTTTAEVILNCVYFEFTFFHLIGIALCVLGAYISSL